MLVQGTQGHLLERNISVAIDQQKETQRWHYDTHHRLLKELCVGQVVRMMPGCKTWSLGVCKSTLGQQSYNVEVAGQTYRNNR